ncbi:hypothetical protein MKZ38_008989 [Zalerion maritima]|uniref:Uncharacterized protein n=1 Tax=Zalerion maritima TaxID=339359 RepID=A0AAD5RH48_9PEZI|nr:hypothetical protein MKZ38_008989 [Zalerion maritima]
MSALNFSSPSGGGMGQCLRAMELSSSPIGTDIVDRWSRRPRRSPSLEPGELRPRDRTRDYDMTYNRNDSIDSRRERASTQESNQIALKRKDHVPVLTSSSMGRPTLSSFIIKGFRPFGSEISKKMVEELTFSDKQGLALPYVVTKSETTWEHVKDFVRLMVTSRQTWVKPSAVNPLTTNLLLAVDEFRRTGGSGVNNSILSWKDKMSLFTTVWGRIVADDPDFGLNDNFGTKLMEEIKLEACRQARTAKEKILLRVRQATEALVNCRQVIETQVPHLCIEPLASAEARTIGNTLSEIALKGSENLASLKALDGALSCYDPSM